MGNRCIFLILLQIFIGLFLTCSGQINCNGNEGCNNMETFEDESLIESDPVDEKRKFSPWAGKRGASIMQPYIIRTRTNTKPKVITHKKSRFSPWHGKRTSEDVWDNGLADILMERLLLQNGDSQNENLRKLLGKRGFNPWAGK